MHLQQVYAFTFTFTWCCITGDVLGPVFSPTSPEPFTVYDLWGTVFMNGEQNMFQMAYNMLMLKYLKLSNQLRSNVRDTILAAICRCESRDVFSLLVYKCMYVFGFLCLYLRLAARRASPEGLTK